MSEFIIPIWNALFWGFLVVSAILTLAFVGLIIIVYVPKFLSWLSSKKFFGKCLFHSWRSRKVIEAGPFWYFECPSCKDRTAVRVKSGKEKPNQRWLDHGQWYDPYGRPGAPPLELRKDGSKHIVLVYIDTPEQ